MTENPRQIPDNRLDLPGLNGSVTIRLQTNPYISHGLMHDCAIIMKNSDVLLIGDAILVIIVIIDLFMSEMESSVQRSRTGYGTGQGRNRSRGRERTMVQVKPFRP